MKKWKMKLQIWYDKQIHGILREILSFANIIITTFVPEN